MMTESEKTAVWGEVFAVRYLRRKGYRILDINYLCKSGEIDIVATRHGVVCFAEVKTRSENTYFPPADAVDERKQTNIKNSAASFMAAAKLGYETRFDIIEVILDDKNYKIRHTENAF